MAGPQVQHSQRPNSAYYTGLNGSGSGSGGAGGAAGFSGAAAGMPSSASHTGLGVHALRQVSNETELIYRGGHSNGGTVSQSLSNSRIIQQQPAHSSSRDNVPGTGTCATDALIGTISTSAGAGAASSSTSALAAALGSCGGGAGTSLKKSNTQRSIEIIVDATQCGKDAVDTDDVEQGDGGGQESSSSVRKSSRHRHRPLHRRLISYLRNLFQGSAAQNGKRSLSSRVRSLLSPYRESPP